MTEWLLPAAFLLGLAGSGHCAAMCGPIVVVLEGLPASERQSLQRRRAFYQFGRGFFYVCLGALAGGGGMLVSRLGELGGAADSLRIAALIVTLVIASKLVFDWSHPWLRFVAERLWQTVRPLSARLLPMDRAYKAFLMGIMWGAIPCGMVYAAAALAMTSGNLLTGIATLFAFWAGTLPALWLAGGLSQIIAQHRRSFGVALAVLAVAGLITLYPGSSHHDHLAPEITTHQHH